jgi:hypothetical protein
MPFPPAEPLLEPLPCVTMPVMPVRAVRPILTALICGAALLFAPMPAAAETTTLNVRISWGHEAAQAAAYEIKPVPGVGVEVQSVTPRDLESGEAVKQGVARSRAGGGDIDALDLVIVHPKEPSGVTQNVHILWTDLIAASDPDTARRLARDPSFRTRPSMLTIQMDAAGTKGFSVSIDQLQTERALWIPSLGVYLTAGEQPVAFADHLRAVASRKGQRILDRVKHEPEATDAQFLSRWEDMGSPLFSYPEQRGPGHIVGITWDSAIRKFGVDRAGGVWNDEGNPDKFRFWLSVGDLARGVAHTWKGQRLTDGLPILTTTFEEDGLRYELEQFAYPLDGPPAERRGDIPMVLMQQVTVRELRGAARRVPVSMTHRRLMPPYIDDSIETYRQGSALLFREQGRRGVLLSVEGGDGDPLWNGTRDYQRPPNQQKRVDATVFLDVPANGTRQFVVKLPSPMVDAEKAQVLAAIDYARAREATLKFWSDYVARGAQFKVPEPRVNDLFRANLWHALRLPRRHVEKDGKDGSGKVTIDLPYSNFAYSQTGTPWPVNQAVYVDYMLYDLRGYHAISTEELEAQFRNNQEKDGHVAGLANWLVYTPAMLYAVAQNYLLSNDRAAFDRLLPYSLAAMDWCVEEILAARSSTAQPSRHAAPTHVGASETARASHRTGDGDGPSKGLVNGPLNDLTGEGLWAFNQAYLYAGLDLFGRALERHGHARAAEARKTAEQLRASIERAFAIAAMRSPLVQLRDGTWTPYVPAEATRPRRLVDDWYATDVDTGAVHLLRLKALPAQGVLADSLLHDHEDNLFYKGWGMANEPVYNQQATAYLLRDEPEAAIRAFYSMMSSAFSHSALEPVEHRWTHGQYFGPPSTDGAWFELYRNMLVHERDGDVLALAQAAPRAWLQDGKTIELTRVPTHYGPMSLTMMNKAGELRADVQMPGVSKPKMLLVRFRHPDKKPMRGVTVNGRAWQDFDASGEWVRIPQPADARYAIVVRY